MQMVEDIPVWGAPLIDAVKQMKAAKQYEAAYCALMADHHIGYSVPVGGVIAYEGKVCVNGVGYDIACGNKAVRLDIDAETVKSRIAQHMDEIQKCISFGIGRKNNETVNHPLFDESIWEEMPLLSNLKKKAVEQLGTVGSGNHYVDIFVDELDRVWIGVHFGSRGLGHSIATHFIEAANGEDGIHAIPVIFDEHSDLGEQYIRCMELAGRYAYAGRDWVCDRVSRILGGTVVEEVHNHHNFAWKERHFGKDLWVIRKGATPAYPGQKGFVGGSMGDISVIIEGIDSEEAKMALASTIHGAGRVLGRSAAKGKVCRKTGKQLVPGLVNRTDHEKWMRCLGVEVRGGDLDESPLAYKRIEQVLKSHEGTIRICHTLKPIGVAMAGAKEFDPYKD